MFVSRSAATDWKERITETSFPEEWVRHYVGMNYTKTDPARRFCFRTSQPFLWSETFAHFRKKELLIFSEAKEFGLRTGAVTPIFSGGTLMGAVGLSSAAAKLNDPRLKMAIDLAAQMFCGVYRQLAQDTADIAAEPHPQLTKRERDVFWKC